jgi:hypothetical protein
MITAAYWVASRAVHRVLGSQAIIELTLGNPAHVFDAARRDVSAALAEPPDDKRVINLLVGAEACQRAGELCADWEAMLVALVGEPWKETLPPTARMFVAQRWKQIELVAAELLFERRALVSRVLELCSKSIEYT